MDREAKMRPMGPSRWKLLVGDVVEERREFDLDLDLALALALALAFFLPIRLAALICSMRSRSGPLWAMRPAEAVLSAVTRSCLWSLRRVRLWVEEDFLAAGESADHMERGREDKLRLGVGAGDVDFLRPATAARRGDLWNDCSNR